MLKNKVAIITGGTRGIGLETARTFLKNGAKVVLLGSKKESVDNAVSILLDENQSYEVVGFYPVLHNESSVKEVFEKTNELYGRIDIVVNNAGMSSNTPLLNYTEEEYDKIANLNIKSVFVVSKVSVPFLEKTKGVIVNTSSMVSIYGQPAGVMYPASKFAVNGITKSLARELAPRGIRVNAVAPGITETDMVASLPKEVIEPLIKTIPLGRIGTPQDVANCIMFLASDLASYVTGEILSVDGAARS
ncbi:MAG: glucose 1-dehydrogenase [Firmicutes bacterium]|nr:glucose 1-dehydrogenase [Bacillota bacterium]